MKLYFLLLLLILVISLRFIYFSHQQHAYKDGDLMTFSARLTKDPEQRGRNQGFSLQPEGYEPVYITAPLFPEFEYADVLQVTGKVQLSAGEKKVFPTMQYPKITVVENDSLLYGLIGNIKEKVRSIYEGSLPPTSGSLLMGIVFGIKSGMPQDFKDALQQAGVYHVVAASGMNVTMVAGAFLGIFGFLLKRQWAMVLSIIGIFFYAFLAGFEPSILRASLMGAIVFSAGIIGRQHLAFWTLGLTGYLMLLWDPGLFSDVGFQLSFLATFGILFIKPALNRAESHGKLKDDNPFSEDFKTTVAAQLATLPVLLSAFGQVSFLSILVNMLVLWTIPPLMVIGAVATLAGFVVEPLGKLITIFALPLLLYFEWVVNFFARFQWSLQVDELPWWIVVGYYFVLAWLVFWRSQKIEV
jgi:competence protein ComEC